MADSTKHSGSSQSEQAKPLTDTRLIKELEQQIRDMFKFEAQRNELNYALSGVERGEMTLQDYEDDLSVAISNWIVKDLLPKYGGAHENR